jgi:hypothetical protein
MTSPRRSLRSIAQGAIEDFTSLMNHVEGDAVMGHVARAARATGATTLRVDLLADRAEDSALLVPPVREAVLALAAWLREQLARDRAGAPDIRAAEMIVTMDPATRRTNRIDGAEELPFTCAVRLTDARGAVHSWRITDWW